MPQLADKTCKAALIGVLPSLHVRHDAYHSATAGNQVPLLTNVKVENRFRVGFRTHKPEPDERTGLEPVAENLSPEQAKETLSLMEYDIMVDSCFSSCFQIPIKYESYEVNLIVLAAVDL